MIQLETQPPSGIYFFIKKENTQPEVPSGGKSAVGEVTANMVVEELLRDVMHAPTAEAARLQAWDLWDQLSFGKALGDFAAGALTPRIARLVEATPSLRDFLGRHCGGSTTADVDSLFAKVAGYYLVIS